MLKKISDEIFQSGDAENLHSDTLTENLLRFSKNAARLMNSLETFLKLR